MLFLQIPHEVKIPYSSRYSRTNAQLFIVGFKVGSESESFNETQPLKIEKQENSLFIQTDKPIYKPSQTSKNPYVWMTGILMAWFHELMYK